MRDALPSEFSRSVLIILVLILSAAIHGGPRANCRSAEASESTAPLPWESDPPSGSGSRGTLNWEPVDPEPGFRMHSKVTSRDESE